MGANPEEPEEAETAPPPPGTNRVEITMAAHTVIESADPLADVVGYAMGILEQTREYAKRIPLGFDVGVAQVERAAPYREPSTLEGWEDDHGRKPARDGGTKRLIPGDYRSRLRLDGQHHR
jgi:hypothetical protein